MCVRLDRDLCHARGVTPMSVDSGMAVGYPEVMQAHRICFVLY
jgi:hypothetical protein